MKRLANPGHDLQAVVTRADLLQLLYPVRVDLAVLARLLHDINQKLDRLEPRRLAPIAALRPSRTRQ